MAWAIIEHWLEFAVRWTHVIVGIAWIGSSFYFIALDLGLRPVAGRDDLQGEDWQVHGGGFYHLQKYRVAPDGMPEDLTWFKWESYSTWLSGFALLILVYYLGGELYLIDPTVLDIPLWAGITISLVSIFGGWLIYDALCKSRFGEDNTKLMVLLFGVLVVMAWGYTQVFSGRAALLHLGAFTATIMSANVFRIIIPNQKIVVADMVAGRDVDPKYGKIAKQRSTHNNYLTLPVLFLMLSNHYPLAFASPYNWVIASLVFLMGVTIRHYFNTLHLTKRHLWWTWGATALLFALIVALSFVPPRDTYDDREAAFSPEMSRLAASPLFAEAHDTVAAHCSGCHAYEPGWVGLPRAPKGVLFETEYDTVFHARSIYLQAGLSHAMPPGVANYMSAEERALLRAWYEGS
ncbi:MAG: urate hydroxylase PuuD [Pseudomonadota bacterium]